MSHISVNPRCPVCNQSPSSSATLFHFFDRVERLGIASVLLARAAAMVLIAGYGALNKLTPEEQQAYLDTLVELLEASSGHVEDMVEAYEQGEPED